MNRCNNIGEALVAETNRTYLGMITRSTPVIGVCVSTLESVYDPAQSIDLIALQVLSNFLGSILKDLHPEALALLDAS